jgi:hypothetical protein
MLKMAELEQPLRLVCVEHRSEMKGGFTTPLLVAALDEANNERKIVLKVRNPDVAEGHSGATSLACELICSVLARSVGIDVPDFAIVDVPAELPPAVANGRARRLLENNLGENFGCEYHEGYALWNSDKRPRSEELTEAIEDVLTFDATVINGDRKTGKPNLLWRGEKTLAIDHSVAIPVYLWDRQTRDSSPLFPEDQVKRHATFPALAGRGLDFQRVLDAWRGLTAADFARLREFVPPTWERTPGDLDAIFSFLDRRSGRLDEITSDLRRILR